MTVRNLIKQSGVTLICTTDDPVTPEWHKKIAEDDTLMCRYFRHGDRTGHER